MPFLVRKIANRDTILPLSGNEDILDILADVPTTEFRTKNGTLSTWYIDSPDSIVDAVLAIAISSTEITSKMDFILIDTDLLSEKGLRYVQSYAGMNIAIPDLQDTHYDITDITLGKLKNCTEVYHQIASIDPDGERYILRFTSGELKDFLRKAIKENRVDESKLPSKKMKELIADLKAKQ